MYSAQIPPEFALLMAVDSAAKPGSNTWTIWSDRRMKKNINPLECALERLLGLRGVTFQWVEPMSQGGRFGVEMGLIADEVQRVFPQWVGRDAKGFQTLTVGGFEALTAEAVRELRNEKDMQIEALRIELDAAMESLGLERDCELEELKTEKDAQIEALRRENEALEARLEKLESAIGEAGGMRAGRMR